MDSLKIVVELWCFHVIFYLFLLVSIWKLRTCCQVTSGESQQSQQNNTSPYSSIQVSQEAA